MLRPFAPPDPARGVGPTPLLEIRDLAVEFRDRWSSGGLVVRAVRGVSLTVATGEVYALVGESGSGKTTLARSALRLLVPTSGAVWFNGLPFSSMGGQALRRVRREIGVVFQSPFASLDPRMRVRDVIAEPLKAHLRLSREVLKARLVELLGQVSLGPSHLDRYPHELSGGQQQRVAIARALALSPRLVVLDEPTSALDVSVQAQVLNLLSELRARFGLAYLLISHDLAVVGYLADRTGVMYLGRLVEEGRADVVFAKPRHPYTRALLDAAPRIEDTPGAVGSERIVIQGDVPSPRALPEGCPFHSRCWLYERLGRPEVCRTVEPPLEETVPGHRAACHFADRAAEEAS